MQIHEVTTSDFPEMLAVWEDSVRATHDFLSEDDIQFLKPIVLEQAFPAVILRCVKNNAGAILGFIGVHEQSIEMLFVLSDARGQGIGKALLNHVVAEFGCNRVDVNEQNPQARGFYEHCGFKVVSRSPLDGQEKPFPILHMAS
ncbi:GNAT family N-acetyltransferase [Parendozoicomonas haliclonae]|nr:GNAT family N-acetyltransferase [Parendozoicomonas haliclonae]